MKNKEIAHIFEHLADILEIKGDNIFRINSYRKASRVIKELTDDIEDLAKENKLKEIPGLGSGMIEKINQYLSTGRIGSYEEIKKSVPEGLIKMLEIPGMGPKTASLVYERLKIKDIHELEQAIKKGKLRDLFGIGEKKEQNILKGISLLKEASKRILLGMALPLVEQLIADLKRKGISQVSPAGSLRRMKETIGDIDILVGARNGKQIISDFVKGANIKEVLAQGDTKGSVIISEGIQVDMRVVEPESYGAALQYFTGSKEHNIHLREIAKKKGMKINEYGVFVKDKKIAGVKEEEVYQALGLAFIPPLMREDRGEIDAARRKNLPQLVTEQDIRGDLHVHSNWSDGTNRIEEIAQAAKEIGYEYIAITDHSRSLKIANGLSPERLEKQIEEIRKINRKIKGFTILCGAEVDIRGDGSLDFPDKLLSKLDIVLAGIHTGFKQSKSLITKRIVSAMKNPLVDVITHPTGRLISARDPYEIDMDEVLMVAKDTNTALEINAHYDRLDLNDIWAYKAKEKGVKLAIGTDAHRIDQLWMIRLGTGVAGRAWLEKNDLLNTFSVAKLLKYLTK